MTTIKKVFSGEDREKLVEEYFKRYHPAGYGTEIISKTEKEIVVIRSSNCD